jgi:uncharacterized SAM-binding protein YcdF (DUF218 family)
MALLIYMTSIPIIADGLVRSMEAQYHSPSKINGDVIITLAGGSTADTPSIAGLGHPSGETAGRIITAAALHQRYHLPIIIAGGQVNEGSGVESEISKQSLVAIGISEEDIIIENKSRSTMENAKYVKQIIDAKGFSLPILVTSAIHMPRSVQHFDNQNITVIPYPAAFLTSKKTYLEIGMFLPSSNAVNKTGYVLREYAGLFLLKKLGISM